MNFLDGPWLKDNPVTRFQSRHVKACRQHGFRCAHRLIDRAHGKGALDNSIPTATSVDNAPNTPAETIPRCSLRAAPMRGFVCVFQGASTRRIGFLTRGTTRDLRKRTMFEPYKLKSPLGRDYSVDLDAHSRPRKRSKTLGTTRHRPTG